MFSETKLVSLHGCGGAYGLCHVHEDGGPALGKSARSGNYRFRMHWAALSQGCCCLPFCTADGLGWQENSERSKIGVRCFGAGHRGLESPLTAWAWVDTMDRHLGLDPNQRLPLVGDNLRARVIQSPQRNRFCGTVNTSQPKFATGGCAYWQEIISLSFAPPMSGCEWPKRLRQSDEDTHRLLRPAPTMIRRKTYYCRRRGIKDGAGRWWIGTRLRAFSFK